MRKIPTNAAAWATWSVSNNIVAVWSVPSLSHKEGLILKRTAVPMLLYGVIAALVGIFLM